VPAVVSRTAGVNCRSPEPPRGKACSTTAVPGRARPTRPLSGAPAAFAPWRRSPGKTITRVMED
jgi:hypothetical protein